MHFSFERIRRWQCQVGSHSVVIEEQRPRWFAGCRRQTFRILVDGAAANSTTRLTLSRR